MVAKPLACSKVLGRGHTVEDRWVILQSNYHQLKQVSSGVSQERLLPYTAPLHLDSSQAAAGGCEEIDEFLPAQKFLACMNELNGSLACIDIICVAEVPLGGFPRPGSTARPHSSGA